MAAAALFLPLSSADDDVETVAWCRGLPLVVAEELANLRLARASFVSWTTGEREALRLCHLVQPAPLETVAAWVRAAGATVGIAGTASFLGDPFVRWDLYAPAGDRPPKKVIVDAAGATSRAEHCRAAWRQACTALGLPPPEAPGPLATTSDAALQSWFQDRELSWYRRKRGEPARAELGFRHLLSALTHDPDYEAAGREVLRRCGEALAPRETPGRAFETPNHLLAIDALSTLVRLRPMDHRAFTLLGMLHGAAEQNAEAIVALRRAVHIFPDYAPGHRELGVRLLAAGDLRASGAHLRRAGSLSPQDPEIHLYLGALYQDLRDRIRAREHLQTVLRIAPGLAVAVTAARFLRDLDDGPARQAGEALRGARLMPTPDRDSLARTFGLPGERLTNSGIDLTEGEVAAPDGLALDIIDD